MAKKHNKPIKTKDERANFPPTTANVPKVVLPPGNRISSASTARHRLPAVSIEGRLRLDRGSSFFHQLYCSVRSAKVRPSRSDIQIAYAILISVLTERRLVTDLDEFKRWRAALCDALYSPPIETLFFLYLPTQDANIATSEEIHPLATAYNLVLPRRFEAKANRANDPEFSEAMLVVGQYATAANDWLNGLTDNDLSGKLSMLPVGTLPKLSPDISHSATIAELSQISQRVAAVQEGCHQQFQSLLDRIAGTTRETYAENKALLDLVQDVRKQLAVAFRYGIGSSTDRVNILLTRSRGSGVGTFSVFTTTAGREYLYHGATFPCVKIIAASRSKKSKRKA